MLEKTLKRVIFYHIRILISQKELNIHFNLRQVKQNRQKIIYNCQRLMNSLSIQMIFNCLFSSCFKLNLINLSKNNFLSKYKSNMGQNICTNVSICNNLQEYWIGHSLEPLKTNENNYIQNSQQKNHNRLQQRTNTQIPHLPHNNQGQQHQEEQTDDFDLLAIIAQHLGSLQSPKQIILSIDQKWMKQSKLFNEGEGFNNYYQQINDIYDRSYSVLERNGKENAKIQVLFQQHIPFAGVFYFKVYLIQYQPQKGLSFVIGIVDYLQAIEKKHSKDSNFQQSFMLRIAPSQISVNSSQEKVDKIKKVIQFTVQFIIDRSQDKIILRLPQEFNQRFREKMKIYGDENQELKLNQGQLEVSLDTKKTLLHAAVSLSPYIQTQYTGLVLGWDKYQSIKSTNYKLSTIIEEGSSIISTI